MQIIWIALLTFFASVVSTLSGFGLSTIMIPVLLLFFPLPPTLLLVGIIHLSGDVWKIILFKKGFDWKIVLSFGIPGVIAAFIGARLSFSIDETILLRLLGALLIFFVLFIFAKQKFKLPKTITTGIAGGALSGLLAGIVGIGGAVRSAALLAYGLPKAAYLTTAGSIAGVIDITRISTYIAEGTRLDTIILWGLFAFIPASFVGAWLAKKIVDKMPEKLFRNIVALFLLLAGIKFIIWP
ncbi:MAG: sulfite exporter TauE/SafE family protein [Candidatus Kerfeldbacteria bacterium]